jgi:tetratricopeptide (TPR) repeat protein
MSLLMKALEKAAKDRQEPAAGAAPHVDLDLQLQPIEPRPGPGAAPAAGARDPAREQAQAATVMRASETRSAGLLAPLLARPVLLVGTLAGIFAVAYGTYVYLQLFHPAMLAPRPAPVTAKPAAVPPPPPPQVAASPAATTPLLPSAATVAAEAAGARPAPAAPAAAREPAAVREAAPAAVAPAPPRETIRVLRSAGGPSVNPVLVQAYEALQANRLADAQRLYGQVAQEERRNTDALLGLAAVAAAQGASDRAGSLYSRVLELEPRNALAQAGLMSLVGGADPQAAESRLRQLLEREPSPMLYATLGDLYAAQRQWAQAQQAYFQAHRLQPDNPENAYNLAVALEHISQPKAALDFYRQSLRLAQARGHANFSLPQVQERVRRLEKFVE